MTNKPRLDLNPSSADRWTTCTASPRFILENWDKVPKQDDTEYNVEGKAAHEVAAATLQDRAPVADHKEKGELRKHIFDDEMFWHGWNYAEYVNGLRTSRESKVLVEQKLPLWYMRERNCIVDAAVLNPDSLHVIDYKYGEGVIVSPVENLQAAIYAITVGTLGQPLPTDFPVFIHIYQPRGRAAEDGADHVWKTTWLDVCKLTEKVTNVACGIQEKTEIEMFAPSEKACQWCPAKGFCEARRQSMTEGLEVIDEANTKHDCLPTPNVLTEHQLVKLLKHKADIVKWLNDVEEWAEEHLKAGGTIPGFKLVRSKGGHRYWPNPKEAEKQILATTHLRRSDLIKEEMVSPKAVEDLLGKSKFKAFANLTAKPEGAPKIAPESDKREAIASAIEDFEVLPPEPTTETENQ